MPYKHNEPRRHKISKARYKVSNWREYDEALQQRGSLTVWVTPEALEAWAPRAIAYEKSGRWFTAEEPFLRAKERTDAGSSAFRHPRSELIAPLPQEVEPAFNNRKLHMRLPCLGTGEDWTTRAADVLLGHCHRNCCDAAPGDGQAVAPDRRNAALHHPDARAR